jgi:hypothetical protein
MSDEELDQIVEALQDHPFGVITQEGFNELRDDIHRWIKRGLIAFGIIGVMCTIALVGFAIALDEIQTQRKDFTREGCESTNMRHDNTIAKLNQFMAIAIVKTPEQAAQIKASQKFTIALIDALSPKRDCEKAVEMVVGQ